MDTITKQYITKYEKARVLGARSLQISMNAPIFVDPKGETDCYKIAIMEFEQKKLPINIIRNLPNGKSEEFSIDQLIDIND